MVSMAPPAHWCERFDCDIETFLDAALATDYATDLLLALCEAARRHHDAQWIKALCNRLLLGRDEVESQDIARRIQPTLIVAAPAESRDGILGQLLGAAKAHQLDLLQPALIAGETGWSADTTQRAFKLLEELAMEGTNSGAVVRVTLADWGSRADVPTAAVAMNRLLSRCSDQSPWRNALEKLNASIEFRTAIRQELLT
jgi:hypothetical protein